MIKDLARAGGNVSLSAQVLIIGGGIAGLLLAVKLRERKIPVVVLESGGPENAAQPHPLNEVEYLGQVYRGALDGRARGLGGTSSLWGGALIPFLAEDMQARPHIGVGAWPVGLDVVAQYMGTLNELFGLDNEFDKGFITSIRRGPEIPVKDPDFMVRFARWPAFEKRNLATLFRATLEKDADVTIYLNATVTSFVVSEAGGYLTGAEGRHVGGNSVRVAAQKLIVCAGAIETTRLLLLLNRQTQGQAFVGCNALGRYFHDHITSRAADLVTSSPIALNRFAGLRFARSSMRSMRFELTPAAQAIDRVGSAFGHISFKGTGASGFDNLRALLRGIQRTGRVDLGAATQMLRDVPYLAKLAYWRYAHKQLRWPEPARYELHIVAEQKPSAGNRIVLANRTDPLGVPRVAIDWRIAPDDYATIGIFARRFDAYWQRHHLNGLGTLNWVSAIRDGNLVALEEIGGVFHPGGTTRMGSSAKDAVVDTNLKTFAVSNLWVASTSVFPSGGSANPTMMLMLFTIRLAEYLGKTSCRERLDIDLRSTQRDSPKVARLP